MDNDWNIIYLVIVFVDENRTLSEFWQYENGADQERVKHLEDNRN